MAVTLPRLAFLRIGKTGSTWVADQLERQYPPHLVCPFRHEPEFWRATLSEVGKYKLFHAHIGAETAGYLNAELVTVLRNPIDRVLSLYHYWKTVEEHGESTLAALELTDFLDLG